MFQYNLFFEIEYLFGTLLKFCTFFLFLHKKYKYEKEIYGGGGGAESITYNKIKFVYDIYVCILIFAIKITTFKKYVFCKQKCTFYFTYSISYYCFDLFKIESDCIIYY